MILGLLYGNMCFPLYLYLYMKLNGCKEKSSACSNNRLCLLDFEIWIAKFVCKNISYRLLCHIFLDEIKLAFIYHYYIYLFCLQRRDRNAGVRDRLVEVLEEISDAPALSLLRAGQDASYALTGKAATNGRWDKFDHFHMVEKSYWKYSFGCVLPLVHSRNILVLSASE